MIHTFSAVQRESDNTGGREGNAAQGLTTAPTSPKHLPSEPAPLHSEADVTTAP